MSTPNVSTHCLEERISQRYSCVSDQLQPLSGEANTVFISINHHADIWYLPDEALTDEKRGSHSNHALGPDEESRLGRRVGARRSFWIIHPRTICRVAQNTKLSTKRDDQEAVEQKERKPPTKAEQMTTTANVKVSSGTMGRIAGFPFHIRRKEF